MSCRRLSSLLCIALLGAAAGGCAVADTGAFTRLQQDMESLKHQVAVLQSKTAAPSHAAAAEGQELTSVQRNMADLSAENDRIKAELLSVSSRADDANLAMQKEISRLDGTTVEQGQAIQELQAKTARLDEIEKRVAALERGGGTAAPGTAPQPTAAKPPAAGTAPASLDELKTPEEMYDYALGLIKNGETKKGREVLNAFAAKYPANRLMQNVYYWKGETFYAEKDYESAILSFQDVIDKYPTGEKAPHAMLKQGLSFQAMGDKKNARILYELVLSKYPKSSAADLAKQKLAALK